MVLLQLQETPWTTEEEIDKGITFMEANYVPISFGTNEFFFFSQNVLTDPGNDCVD